MKPENIVELELQLNEIRKSIGEVPEVARPFFELMCEAIEHLGELGKEANEEWNPRQKEAAKEFDSLFVLLNEEIDKFLSIIQP